MELGTDEHVKKIIVIEKLTEFYLSYVRVLESMGSSASIQIRASGYCYSMCPIGCGSSRRKSDGIIVVASGQYYLGIGCFSATRSLKPPLQAYTSHLRQPLISFLVWLWLLDYCLIKINAVIHHLLHRWMTVIIVMT